MSRMSVQDGRSADGAASETVVVGLRGGGIVLAIRPALLWRTDWGSAACQLSTETEALHVPIFLDDRLESTGM